MKTIPLKIHTWPDPVLRRKCKKVGRVDNETRTLLDKMYYLMKKGDGVGLAANQAGLEIALVVIEVEDKLFKLVNPRIVKREGTQRFEEGCLSFPGLTLDISRAARVWVTALDEDGEQVDIEAEGVAAVVFQHEIDHINGIVFIDRIPLLKRITVKRRLPKKARA